MARRLDIRDGDFETVFDAFLAASREPATEIGDQVAAIIAGVRQGGDEALCAYTGKFDGFELSPPTMRIPANEIETARASCEAEVLDALALAARRIESFHAKQMPDDLWYEDEEGAGLGYRWTAVRSAGIYVPGGTASYPSSVLMNAIPARVAGVERLVMTVPTPRGEINPLVLATAQLAGVDEIYRVGGAQAIAALAYGTKTIAPVDKVVGPGNVYVAEAKRQVFGKVGIDLIAGPSEILVIADGSCPPAWIAADLLAQAEHDVSARSILITVDQDFADKVVAEIEEQLRTLPRANIARTSWQEHGAVILVENLGQAAALADRIAPEHLALAVGDAEGLAGQIRHAGAIFLGPYATEALGDYLAGPNHVLPTAATARFSSGLSVFDFLKRSTMMGFDRDSLAKIGPAAVTLARAEGLEGHARSVSVRLKGENGE